MARNKKKKLWKRDNVDVSKLNIAESTTIHITQQLQKFFESKAEGIQIFFFNIISVTVMWVLLLLFYVFWFSV